MVAASGHRAGVAGRRWLQAFGMALVLAAAAAPVEAQSNEVFTPYVSRLRARVDGGVVRLTWRPSEDVTGSALIYRATEVIDAGSIGDAELVATVATSTTAYTDAPPEPGTYFYAVVLEDATGERYEVFIPFRNQTSGGAAVQRVARADERAATVSDLQAQVDAEAIVITFRADRDDRELLLFRATRPMATAVDLLASSTPVPLRSSRTQYTDEAIPGIEYYYALVDAELFKLGRATLVPGANATVRAAALPVAVSRIALPPRTTRPAPLPLLRLSSAVQGDGVPLAVDPAVPVAAGLNAPGAAAVPALAAATGEALQGLAAAVPSPLPPAPRRELQLLDEDRSVSSGREDFGLQTIVHERLVPGSFAEGERLLRSYLSLRRAPQTLARSRFYLGQALYFQGRYREAMLEFLLAKDRYPIPGREWIDATFAALQAAEPTGDTGGAATG